MGAIEPGPSPLAGQEFESQCLHTTNSLREVGCCGGGVPSQDKWAFADSKLQFSGLGTVSFNISIRNLHRL